ncbi:class I SAM-dependent methyltransferase [Scopulibacillus cellulosilyticus]|uniref:Class I SAM-dependent methyltransferase n=1 Tax=Scopulibacillus cellulosilyticus TaxID=2665665 RepID=A0ABW2PYI5_9BACL
MGDFTMKYSNAYFLGEKDLLTQLHYGLSGFKEFKKNDVHKRFIDIFQFIKSFAGDLKGKDVLEIGYGRGELIPFFLKEKCQSYHGIDFSEAAFNIARRRYNDSNVKLVMMEAKDLQEKNAYDVIVMNHVIEHIPVFEMEIVWDKVKKALRPGGFIILGTQLYDNPNEADQTDECQETMGMHCHKQTKGTILRTCLEQQFVFAKSDGNYIGLIRKDDLHLFPTNKKDSFLATHHHKLSEAGLNIESHFTKEDLRKLVPKAGRMVIGCVTENNSKFQERTLRLVQSIRWFGGSMAGVNIIVCIVDKADSSFVDELKKWGAFVRIVKRFSKAHPPSNKLRFFECPEINSYDTIMFLDCDTVIVQDPAPYIDGKHFQAKIANGCSVPHDVFKRLFKHYGLRMPRPEYRTSNKNQKTIWYCNTGVLIFPQPVLQSFFPVWKSLTKDLAGKRKLMKKSHFFCEQASLTLAFVKKSIPYKQLTNEMNCPTGEKKLDPVIIHYRNSITKDNYLRIKEKHPNAHLVKRVQAFNHRLRDYRKNL